MSATIKLVDSDACTVRARRRPPSHGPEEAGNGAPEPRLIPTVPHRAIDSRVRAGARPSRRKRPLKRTTLLRLEGAGGDHWIACFCARWHLFRTVEVLRLEAEDAVRHPGFISIVHAAMDEPGTRGTSIATSLDSPIVQALCLSARSEWAAVPANVPSDGGGLGGRSTIDYSIG